MCRKKSRTFACFELVVLERWLVYVTEAAYTRKQIVFFVPVFGRGLKESKRKFRIPEPKKNELLCSHTKRISILTKKKMKYTFFFKVNLWGNVDSNG